LLFACGVIQPASQVCIRSIKDKETAVRNLIYIVSEDIQLSNHIQKFLTRQDYELRFFDNSNSLYNTFIHKRCTIAIIDLDTPGIDNIAVHAKIRQASNLPMILLVSNFPGQEYVLGLSMERDIYLAKPFSDIQLFTYIRALVIKVYFEGRGIIPG